MMPPCCGITLERVAGAHRHQTEYQLIGNQKLSTIRIRLSPTHGRTTVLPSFKEAIMPEDPILFPKPVPPGNKPESIEINTFDPGVSNPMNEEEAEPQEKPLK
jgi:hypothetical protein